MFTNVGVDAMTRPSEATAPAGWSGFDEFVRARSAALLRFAFLLTGNREDASDLVQDALVGLYPRWERISRAGDPEPYVRRSITNARITRWRRHREHASDDLSVLDGVTDDLTAEVTDAHVFGQLFATLSTRQRAALVLRFYDDLEFSEIARQLDCAEPTARSLVHRALADLRARLSGGDHHG